jgi:hypothetical protein
MHEETPVDSILSPHSFEEVFAEIESILETESPENIPHALGFIRDANLYDHPFREGFRNYLATARTWEIFRDLLKAPNFLVRCNTIYTIGKITDRSRAYLLGDAFPYYLERDPINLPRLLCEHTWLTKKWNWDWLEQIAVADHYIKRWSLCEIPDHFGLDEADRPFLEVFTQLKSDTNPLVAAEANFHFEQIKLELGPKLPKAEWRKEVKRINSLEPKVLFESTAMRFMQNRTDYNLEEFDRFVRNNGDENEFARARLKKGNYGN